MIEHEHNAVEEVQVMRLKPTEEAIITTLLYFDIFRHPLTVEEIYQNSSDSSSSPEEIRTALKGLTARGLVFESEGFYFLHASNEIINRRKNGNIHAKKYLKIARRMSAILSNFPFVRGISLSGSLSKGYMDKGSDIDYFIITEPNRLWLSRTILVLFKKIFLLNSRKWLCLNYFIDDASLQIPDKNIFVATEILYLIPTYNYVLHRKFLASNSWVKNFKPNFHPNGIEHEISTKPFKIKNWTEHLLNGWVGDKLDDFCFAFTYWFWKKKFNHLKDVEFNNALRSRKNVSKHHPRNFQKLVLQKLEEKKERFESKYHITLKR